MEFLVVSVSSGLAFSNKLFFNPEDINRHFKKAKYCSASKKHPQIFAIGNDQRVPVGSVGVAPVQSVGLNVALQVDKLFVTAVTDLPCESKLVVFDVGAKASVKTFSAADLETAVRAQLKSHWFGVGQRLAVPVGDVIMRLQVTETDSGVLSDTTLFRFDSSSIKFTANPHANRPLVLPRSFDFESLGIGGLDKEFEIVFRRAFASRLFAPSKIKELGQTHVKGMILYGPPGTGKTLIATKLSELLQGRTPILKSGPELMSKYYGDTERQIRELFDEARKEQDEVGDESLLHTIIIDEIDAIARGRGSSTSDIGDSAVNQLLDRMDGTKKLNNILVIGMTNRLSLLDDALLRPGRFEIHLEIGLPDEAGRNSILKIHTATMREHNRLGSDVDLAHIAQVAKNFTGSEIGGLVRSATSFALASRIDPKKISDRPLDMEGVQVTKKHFDQALLEVKPRFGGVDTVLRRPPTMVPFGPRHVELMNDGELFVEQVRTSAPFVTVLLEGSQAGAGSTSVMRSLAINSQFSYIREINSILLANRPESKKVAEIVKIFEDARRVPLSVVLLDNLERLVEYTPAGNIFSNAILQTIMTYLQQPPDRDGHRMLVMATTSSPKVAQLLGLRDCFMASLQLSPLSHEESITFLQSYYDDAFIDKVQGAIHKSGVPLKILHQTVTAVGASSEAEFIKTLTLLSSRLQR